MDVPSYIDSLQHTYHEVPSAVFAEALHKEETFKQDLLHRNGKENVHKLHDELSDLMVKNVTVKRNNVDLKYTIDHIKKIKERYKHITLDDTGSTMNQTFTFANQFRSMLELALVMTKGALLRNEFRGAHYKPEFPERNDTDWLKTTIATYQETQDEPVITYKPVDTCYLKPQIRDYSKARKVVPHFENLPSRITLPV